MQRMAGRPRRHPAVVSGEPPLLSQGNADSWEGWFLSALGVLQALARRVYLNWRGQGLMAMRLDKGEKWSQLLVERIIHYSRCCWFSLSGKTIWRVFKLSKETLWKKQTKPENAEGRACSEVRVFAERRVVHTCRKLCSWLRRELACWREQTSAAKSREEAWRTPHFSLLNDTEFDNSWHIIIIINMKS